MGVLLKDVMGNPKLLAVYMEFAVKTYRVENIRFLFDVNRSTNEALYKRFLGPTAPQEINIKSDERAALRALGEAKDWKNKDWKKWLSKAENTIELLWKANDGREFAIHKLYTDWVAANTPKPKIKANPAKAAKLLGISDVEKLKKAMQAQIEGDTDIAKKLYAAIIKEEELKQKVDDLMKVLDKAGLA